MGAKYKRPTTPAERARREHAAEDKLSELHTQLAEQVAALRTGQDWRRWLDVAHRFHTYSFNNTLLIWAQRPEATAVAGFQAWKALGRQVDKGERGIQILAPVVRRTSSGGEAADAAGQDKESGPAGADPARPDPPAASALGEGSTVSGERRVAGFRITYVWDVSQTSGDPLPTRPEPQLLVGQAPPGLWESLHGVVTDHGFTLERGDCGPANGWTDFTTRVVRVRDGVDDAQAVKTLSHELGHVLLHEAGDGTSSPARCRGREEVEAESVAYLIAAEHGLATDGYSFAYVTGWAADLDREHPETVVRDTGERVLGAARTVLAVTQPQPSVDAEVAAQVHAGAGRTSTLRDHAEATLTSASTAPHPVDATHRTGLAQVHTDATDFYAAQLAFGDGDANRAAAVLEQRGVTPDLVTAYQIGYAPPSWTALTEHLHGRGYTDEQLLDAGVAMTTRGGTVVDRFRDRIMFPVHDQASQVIAFVGRALEQRDDTPKYLNSPETALYRKSAVLYGLGSPLTRQALADGARPVLVEGPMDAIAVTSTGAYAGVAPSGTALTPGQIAALGQALGTLDGRDVIVAFDGDQAGQIATLRAFEPLRDAGAWPTTAALPAGQDPASLAELHGAQGLRQALDAAVPIADLVVDRRVSRWTEQLRWVDGRVGAARDTAHFIAALPAQHMARQIDRLVDRLGLLPETVTAAVVEAIAKDADARGRLASGDYCDHRDRDFSVPTPSQVARTNYPDAVARTTTVSGDKHRRLPAGAEHRHPGAINPGRSR